VKLTIFEVKRFPVKTTIVALTKQLYSQAHSSQHDLPFMKEGKEIEVLESCIKFLI
jgi:hypothetical protein